MCLKRSSLV